MADGRIMLIRTSDGSAHVFAKTGGRPGGLDFDAGGNLIVADSVKGLLSVAPNGKITLLSKHADGRPIRLANDLDIAADGTVYFRL